MKPVVSGQWSVFSSCVQLTCLLFAAYCLLGCSVPNLEPRDCTAARDVVREFYSFHFGTDMSFTPSGLENRRRFLTPDFYEKLKAEGTASDPFTLTSDLPKAFRVGECSVTGSGVIFNVLLFWKTDTRTEQRFIKVLAKNVNGEWRIASVEN